MLHPWDSTIGEAVRDLRSLLAKGGSRRLCSFWAVAPTAPTTNCRKRGSRHRAASKGCDSDWLPNGATNDALDVRFQKGAGLL